MEIHVTGFGSFHGVKENPSQMLAEYYQNHLQDHGLASSTLLEVSTEAVEHYLNDIRKKFSNGTDVESKKVVLLHLGVSASSKQYEIETRGKNEATFRAPDEKQYQPFRQAIDPDHPLNSWRYTSLPIESITQHVNQTLVGLHLPLGTFAPVTRIEATKNPLPFGMNDNNQDLDNLEDENTQDGQFLFPSRDAGLFLCNYLYYSSLKTIQDLNELNTGACFDSVFVHIPSHKTIPMDQQRTFVDNLIKSINLTLH
jgi:pyroglutamyl-peptidase